MVLVKGQVHFEENLASRSGGAMSVYAPQELRITGSTFVSNAAEIGGAIALTSSGEEGTEFHGCTFEKNSAKDGGALYMYTNEWDESVSNCTFRENYAGDPRQIENKRQTISRLLPHYGGGRQSCFGCCFAGRIQVPCQEHLCLNFIRSV